MYEFQTLYFFLFKCPIQKESKIQIKCTMDDLEFFFTDSRDQVKVFIFLIIIYFTLVTCKLQAG